jgi:hypothetical protein
MTTLSASVEIEAPVEATWQVVTDWQRQGEWIPLTVVLLAAGSSAGLGARISARSGIGALSFLDPMVVDVWEPPHRCEVVHLGKVVTGRGVFLVEPLPGGRSRFTWSEVLDSVGVRRVVDRLGMAPTRMMFRVAVNRLARLVDTQAMTAGTS